MSKHPPPLYPPSFVPPFRSIGMAMAEYLNQHTTLEWWYGPEYARTGFVSRSGVGEIAIHAYENHIFVYSGYCEIRLNGDIQQHVPMIRDIESLHYTLKSLLNHSESLMDDCLRLRLTPQT